MIPRLSNALLLQPSDIKASQSDWKVIGVFNPAVAICDDKMFMLVRVAEQPVEERIGWTAIPYWSMTGEVSADWMRDEQLEQVDSRVVRLIHDGTLRLTSVSHLQLFRQTPSNSVGWEFVCALLPEGANEQFGIEDPRITKLDDTYWITYVAVSRAGAATALMSTQDLVTFRRHGIIFASENKDVVLFPERIGGCYVALHRPNPNSRFSPPQIWIAYSPDLIHWGGLEPIIGSVNSWEGDRVGSGTPPILIDEGWLMLYHGVESANREGEVGRYAAGALLLDREHPSRVIARSRDPIMLPITDFEKLGFVPNVVFPTSLIADGQGIQVFYGAADTYAATARFSKRSVSDSLSLQSESQV